MNTEGLAVVNLRLGCVDNRGDPYKAVVNYLEAFFLPNAGDAGLNTLDLDFDIKPGKAGPLERHQKILNAFVKKMCQ